MKIKKIQKRQLAEKENVFCITTRNDQMFTFRPKGGNASLASRNCNFGFIYGSWWTSYQQIQLVKNKIKVPDAEAKLARESFMKLYRTVAQHVEQAKHKFKTGKPRTVIMTDSYGNQYAQQLPYMDTVSTLLGRRIAVEDANTWLNYGIQGSGGSLCKLSIILFEDICREENINAFVCNLIHDDIVCQSTIEDEERAQSALARAMNGAANLVMGHYFLTDVAPEIATLAKTPMATT